MTIGEFLKKQREELHLSQAAVGKAIGVDKATVSRWEYDQMEINRKHISGICNTLHIDPVIFCHPNEVIFPEERQLIMAWRSADTLTRAMVRRNLGIEEKNDTTELMELSTLHRR